MKEAAWLLSTALPEDGSRMIKGPGRFACFRGRSDLRVQGVPAQGPGQAEAATQVRRSFMDRRTCEELSQRKIVDLERSARLLLCTSTNPSQNHFAVFLGDRISRKLRLKDREFSRLNVGFFPSFSPYSSAQKTTNLLCDDRFTALMPAEMSYSNRLGRGFQLKKLMPIRHRVGVYGIRRCFLASE